MTLKKAIFPEEELPPLTVYPDGTFGYRVRYRIVSEDGNRTSHFSPVFNILANYVFQKPQGRQLDDVAIGRTGPYINIVWDPVFVTDRPTGNVIKRQSLYDVWLRWSKGEGNASWVPVERFEGNFQSFWIPPSYTLTDGTIVEEEPNELSVEIYVRATVQSRDNSPLLVYQRIDENISAPVSPPNV